MALVATLTVVNLGFDMSETASLWRHVVMLIVEVVGVDRLLLLLLLLLLLSLLARALLSCFTLLIAFVVAALLHLRK